MSPFSNRKAIWGSSCTSFRVFWTLGYFGKTGAKYLKTMGRVTQKVIQSVKPYITCQMRPYSSINAIQNYIPVLAFLGNWVIGGNLTHYILNHGDRFTESDPTFHIKWDLPQKPRPFEGQVIPVSMYSKHWGKSGKLAPNTSNHREEYTKSDPKCSPQHFISNETLLKSKDQLKDKL